MKSKKDSKKINTIVSYGNVEQIKKLKKEGYVCFRRAPTYFDPERLIASEYHGYAKFHRGTQVELGMDSEYRCAECGATVD